MSWRYRNGTDNLKILSKFMQVLMSTELKGHDENSWHLFSVTSWSTSFDNSSLTPKQNAASFACPLGFSAIRLHLSLGMTSCPSHTQLALIKPTYSLWFTCFFIKLPSLFLLWNSLKLFVPLKSDFLQTDIFLSPTSSEHWQLCLHYFLCTFMLLRLTSCYSHLLDIRSLEDEEH